MEEVSRHAVAHANEAQTARARALAIDVARLLDDDKCEDVLVLDVGRISALTDFIVIATGTSDRQMRAVLHHAMELAEAGGHAVFGSSADARATWLVADFVDVVVHVFEPNTRAHYDLEMLWGDGDRVDWSRPQGARPPGARRNP